MIDHLKRSEMFRAHIAEQPVALMPLMTIPAKPVEKDSAATYMRALFERTLAMLRDRGKHDG